MADQTLAFPGLGPARRRGDPRIPPLKSAVQKYVRRGEVAKAVATAKEMMVYPGGEGQLLRRLPVIAAEDVGPSWVVPTVFLQSDKLSGVVKRPPEREILQMVASLAAAPKSKEAYWLADLSWEGRTELPHPAPLITPGDLREEIEAGEYRTATAMCIELDEIGRLHGRGGIASALHEWAATLPEWPRTVVKTVLWRTARGGAGELFPAAMIAGIGRQEPPELTLVGEWEEWPRPKPLDWYTQDGHTRFGGIGCGIAAKKWKLKSNVVKNLMFNHSSIVMWPDETLNDRWRIEALDLDAREDGWKDHEDAGLVWSSIKADVQSGIEWVMKREYEKGGFV